MNNKICILPICGSATRIGNIPKFLLPITSNVTLLKETIKKAFDNGFHINIFTTPDYGSIIYNYLKNNFDMKQIKINLMETSTMSETVLGVNYNINSIYSLLMPDTYFEDDHCLTKLYDMYNVEECDIVLGVFEIRNEQKGKLGQVLFDNENNLIDVIDKDATCEYKYAWGTILWNHKFFYFIDETTSHIGKCLPNALNNGLKIKVCVLDGQYYDCGTVDEYKLLLSKHNLLLNKN